MLCFAMQGVMVESPMLMEMMEESSTASNSPTNQKNQTLAILLVPGSIEGIQEPKDNSKV